MMVDFCLCHPAKDLPPSSYRTNIQFVHQPQDCLVVDANALVPAKPQGNSPISIGLVRCLIRFLHLLHALFIWIGLLQTSPPLIIGRSRNPEELAHGFYFVSSALVVDEPILRLASSSLRNSAWNFFSKSISI